MFLKTHTLQHNIIAVANWIIVYIWELPTMLTKYSPMKSCFIIMPISDVLTYENGHFKRVYEYIIKPACELAGFTPTRADDVINTNYIALDIIKKIIESDMAICDLSSKNPNVLYELGIRQAFNKPVSLIKDTKTSRIFDIQGFRDIVYDETLRIDNVRETIENLAQNLTMTYQENENDVNSLIKLLGITPAKVESKTKISIDTELILNSLSSIENRISFIEKAEKRKDFDPRRGFDQLIDQYKEQQNYPLEAIKDLKVGDFVLHKRFGVGEVIKLEGDPSSLSDYKGEIKFEDGTKKLVLNLAYLKKHSR